MKKLFLFTTTILLLFFFLSACKKNKDETTAEKLQHKWTIVDLTDNYHDASGDNIDNTAGMPGDFINFDANGTYTSQSSGSTDSGVYSLIGDTQISIDGDTSTIKTLTSTQLVLYLKYVYTASEYEEFTINLKR